MKLYMIRHASTKGNLEKRYIGRTDQPLSAEGIVELKNIHLPVCEVLIASPMKRCIQTAELLYPHQEIQVCEAFRECDFGDFENHNYYELSGSTDYQQWIDSNGTARFPNGESPSDFKARTIAGFQQIIQKYPHVNSMAMVVHGGTIMAISEAYAIPRKSYYDYQVRNAHGYFTEFYGEHIYIYEKI